MACWASRSTRSTSPPRTTSIAAPSKPAPRAGVPVLCEKPLAATLADAEAMVAACRTAGTLFGTAFDQRRHPAHCAIRATVAAGHLGTVTAVRIVYACWLGRDWSTGTGANWRVDAARPAAAR